MSINMFYNLYFIHICYAMTLKNNISLLSNKFRTTHYRAKNEATIISVEFPKTKTKCSAAFLKYQSYLLPFS